MVVVAEEDRVNHGGTTSRKVNVVIIAHHRRQKSRRLSEYPNDAWASRELVTVIVYRDKGGPKTSKGRRSTGASSATSGWPQIA